MSVRICFNKTHIVEIKVDSICMPPHSAIDATVHAARPVGILVSEGHSAQAPAQCRQVLCRDAVPSIFTFTTSCLEVLRLEPLM